MNYKKFLKILAMRIILLLPDNLQFHLMKFYFTAQIKNLPEYHHKEMRVIEYLVKKGDCVVDAGSNIGVFSNFFSRLVEQNGLVLAFEPVPRTARYFRNTIFSLELNNIKLFQAALSNTQGPSTMSIPKYDGQIDFYRATLSKEIMKQGTTREVEVKTMTLDSLLPKIKREVTFIKCDIMGHELHFLEGSIELIKKFKPAMMIEVYGNPFTEGTQANKVFNLLAGLDYKAYCLNKNKLEIRTEDHDANDTFFLTKEQAAKLKTLIFSGNN